VLGNNRFLVAGGPLGVIDSLAGTAEPLAGGEAFGGQTASFVVGDDLLATALVVGTAGAALVRDDQVESVEAPASALRERHQVILVGDRVLVLAGIDDQGTIATEAIAYDPINRTFSAIPDFLAVPRADVGATTTSRHLVVAGGVDDVGVSGAVEVFDVDTLEPIATTEMAIARQSPSITSLENGQVLIAGGLDSTGEPISLIELFNPGD